MKKLHYDLFIKYDRKVRPVKDWRHTTTVTVGVTLTNMELCTKKKALESDAWIFYVSHCASINLFA